MSRMHDHLGEWFTVAAGRTLLRRSARAGAVAGSVAALALAGCQSDGGRKQVDYQILSPSEWFASADDGSPESDEKSGISGETSGDIGTAPVPPPVDASGTTSRSGATPPPAPTATGESYYGVRPTASHRHTTRDAAPTLLPVPGASR